MSIKHYIQAALFILITQGCLSQTTSPYIFSSAGTSHANDYGSITWTIGEPLIETGSTGNYVVTQGFEQPGDATVTGGDNPEAKTTEISAYPNPVSEELYIRSSSSQTLLVEVENIEGQLMLEKRISTPDNASLNMGGLSTGLYFLKIYDTNNHLIRVLKIDKIK